MITKIRKNKKIKKKRKIKEIKVKLKLKKLKNIKKLNQTSLAILLLIWTPNIQIK